MYLPSNQATVPPAGTAGDLAREIGQLRNSLQQAQSSGCHVAAVMIELDLLGLDQKLIDWVGYGQAIRMMDG